MKWRAWYWRLLAIFVAFTFAGTIAYSRMFLGVHSLNQVLYGLSLGIWFAVTSEFMLRERFMSLIQNLIDVEDQRLKRLLYLSLIMFAATTTL